MSYYLSLFFIFLVITQTALTCQSTKVIKASPLARALLSPYVHKDNLVEEDNQNLLEDEQFAIQLIMEISEELDQNLTTPEAPSCNTSAMIQIVTLHPWKKSLIVRYRKLIADEMVELEKYGGTKASDLGVISMVITKVQTINSAVFGERFFVDEYKHHCNVLHEFVRKAVSWSSDIPRATLACRCEEPLEIMKIGDTT